ncbi:MAG: alpha/beta fold hydrolase [Rubripirellula sp.]
MKESTCRFGEGEFLFGILTTPDREQRVEDAPVAIILNAGIVHRVGPFRLHVGLARDLAMQGYTTLRMDLSGIGDSAPRTGKQKVENRAQLDVRSAMKHLEKTIGAKSFVLIGLCSGAYNAHLVSVEDKRVIGGVFLDGIAFRTPGFYFRHHVLRYLRPRFWRNAIKRRLLQRRRGKLAQDPSLAQAEFFYSESIGKDRVTSDLRNLLQRGVQMLLLYTDGCDEVCGRSQFREMYGLMPDDGQLQVEYYPKSEHTFRLTENRRAACDRITSWMRSRFPSHRASSLLANS